MIYLDNAATSFPKPQEVYREMDLFFRERGANPGRAGYRMSLEAERELEGTRKLLASIFGAKNPNRIIFTLNATDALNMAIKGLLRQGDHVVTSTLEHNSVTRPLENLQKRGTITSSRVRASQEGFIDPEDIKKAINPKTRLVVITHASNVLGTVQPLKDIGRLVREEDLIFMVDAAQSAGVWPISVEEECIDLLAFTGHKGLFGPPGTGGLYVGDRVELAPWREGGTGVNSQSPSQPEALPFRLEGGTPNFVGIVGLKSGVEFLLAKGIDSIRSHGHRLLSNILRVLEGDNRFILYGPKDTGKRLSIVSLNIKDSSPSLVGSLLDESFDIAVRSGLHCAPFTHKELGTFPEGTVRISPGYFNTEDDVAQAVCALKEIASSIKTAGPQV
ncbi:MAG: aminotransferase class V-fold PLP-dependent enzyme [Candidatus Brocadiales bacterium]|nr:aminotransferase class V-fold PLP-dependent enzyme [Candidatus Brocadiales bacterium]